MKKSCFLFSVVIMVALGSSPAISLSAINPGGELELGKCECSDGKMVDWGATCPDGMPCGLAPVGPGLDEKRCECSDGTKVDSGDTCPDGSVCELDMVVMCNEGYWGGVHGICKECPLSDDGIRGTCPAGSDNSTDCYIPSGTEFADDTGSGVYTDNCHYSLQDDFIVVP